MLHFGDHEKVFWRNKTTGYFGKTVKPPQFLRVVTCPLRTHHRQCGRLTRGARSVRFKEGYRTSQVPNAKPTSCLDLRTSHDNHLPFPSQTLVPLNREEAKKVLNISIVKNNKEEFKERIYLSHINKPKGIT